MRFAAMLGTALSALATSKAFKTPFHNPIYGVDGTSHHMRRGNGRRITGYSGAYIRECNVKNGVGSKQARRKALA